MRKDLRAAAPTGIRFERRDDGLGIGTNSPRISWLVAVAPDGWRAVRAEVESISIVGDRMVAETGPRGLVERWPFAPLRSGEKRQLRVRLLGSDGEWTPWSAPADVEAGLLDSHEWVGSFVAAPWPEDSRVDQAPPLIRGIVPLAGPVASARLRVTSLGVHEVEINGVRIGDDLLSPGWSSFANRLRYVTHDVSDIVAAATTPGGPGELVIGAWLGDGWYRGRIGWNGRLRNLWGDRLALLAQLELRYADGSVESVGTTDSWRATRGPILRSGIYDGERYDEASLPDGWSLPGFDDSNWAEVDVLPWPSAQIVAYDGPPVRVVEEIEPTRVTHHDGGGLQVDFGQNLVGRLRVRAASPSPFGLRLRHAEMMQDGELALRPLRTAEAFDTYWPTHMSGRGDTDDGRRWSPRFTFHGFRYADIEGTFPQPAPSEIVAEVIHSDMRRTGWFRCSNPQLQQLHQNVVWSMRGNFVDLPTDCPQRDERLGWTGDLQIFGPTAVFLYDCSGVLRSWLKDVAAEQRESGAIPHFVPDVEQLDPEKGLTSIWGDVATLTPWDLYTAFGDDEMLAEQYPTARRWVEGLRALAVDETLIQGQFQFGDWLDPTAPPDRADAAKADSDLLATAYYYRSAKVLSQMAEVIDLHDDATQYAQLAERIRTAFLDYYSPEPGRLTDDAQASYATAIRFEIFDDAQTQQVAGARLANLVRENGHHIGTGFAGTPAICDALARTGHLDDAYALLLQTESPSWLYPVTQGATTIWERWDSLKPNGRINDSMMTSFNHYALGAVADFLHRTVAGLAPASPGYERILFRPRPGGGLTSAGATLDTPFGTTSIDWELQDSRLTVRLQVPVGSTGSLDLSGLNGGVYEVAHGSHCIVADISTNQPGSATPLRSYS